MSTLHADYNFWDPPVRIFDFSLKFEEVIFQLVPSVFSVFLFPLFAYRYRHHMVYVRTGLLLGAKLLFSLFIVACQAAAIGLHSYAAADRTDTAMAAASVELLAAISLMAMLYIDHRHCIRSSGFLAMYLLITFGIDIIKCRSYFIRSGLGALGSLAAATATLRFVLLILEERSKHHLLLDDDLRNISGPEATCGFFTRLLFLFLYPMFMRGFSRQLRVSDLEKLGSDFSSKLLHQKLQNAWEMDRIAGSKYQLFLACFYAFKRDLMLICVPRLANIGATFSQPYLIQLVTETADFDANGESYKVSAGRRGGMQFSTALIFITLAVAKAAATHLSNILTAKVRGAVIAKLMDKTHALNEQEAKKSAVLTHMSSDITQIVKGLPAFVDIPMVVLEVAVGVFLLSRFIGSSCFLVLLPVLGANLFCFWLGKKSGPAMARWNKRIEIRIAKTTEVLAQLPGIKMLGLGPTMRDQIHHLRVIEMDVSKPYRYYMAFLNACQQFADICVPVVVVGGAFFWRGFGHQMSSTLVFPTLAVVNLIQGPTCQALLIYTNVAAMVACFGRIQAFMVLPEREDSRVTVGQSKHSSSGEIVPSDHEPASIQSQEVAKDSSAIIQFKNASFGPAGMEEPLLVETNLSLVRGSVSGVLAPTGSGKSTFMESILGEAKIKVGSIHTDPVNIAYCGGNTWLRDASVRDNIIGCLEFDLERYQQAVQTCQLEQDIEELPGGDEFIVGPNGFNLSGGQRQRVSLARAVFAQCDITIIDDGVSSLDRKTATSVLSSLCGTDGVLRRNNSTVLISTYLPEVMDMIDNLITIRDGRIVVEDPRGQSARTLLIAEYSKMEESRSVRDFESEKQALISQLEALKSSKLPSDEDTSIRQKGSWRLYLMYIDSIGRKKSLNLAIVGIFLAASEFLPEIYMRVWTETSPTSGIWFIGYVILAFFACVLVLITYWVLYMDFALKGAIVLHKQMLDTTMGATLGFLTNTKTGHLLNRFSQDCDLLGRVLPGWVFRSFYMICSLAILVGIILSSATFMCISLPVIVAAIYFTQRFYLRTSRQMRHLDLEETSPLYTFFTETASGLLHLQAFGWRSKNMERGYRLLDKSQQPYYLMLCIQQWLAVNLGLLSAAVAFTMVSIVLWARRGANGSSVGLSFLSILNFQRTLIMLLEAWTGAETSIAAMLRLEEFKNNTPQETSPSQPEVLPENWAPKGCVDFSNVTSRYSFSNDSPSIIKDFSLALKAGTKVGIVGRTGSGKSSLLLTLLGFLYHEGVVEIDGINIKNMDLDFLRSRVISITQDSVQLNETVRKNLLPFTINDDDENLSNENATYRQSEDSRLIEVLQSLNLWTQIVEKGGLAVMLTDTGYSKGELQLFSIARAVIRRHETSSRLVLIDEATSNLDALRDEATQAVLREAFKDCTVLTIAHREETIQRVDFKVSLDGGKMTTPGASEKHEK